MPLIAPAELDDPYLIRFLDDHLSDLLPTAPAESRHALDVSAMRASGVRIWAMRDHLEVLGTVALAPIVPGHEELKSMRSDPAHRGAGIGAALLQHVFEDARARGLARISLETGSMDFFSPARRLYSRAGFTECPPFGSYVVDPHSVYMTLAL